MSSNGITAYYYAHRALLKYMKKTVTLRQIDVFLHVALQGPVTMKQLTKALGGKSGALYDDLQDLGKVAASGRPGARLIEEVPPAVEGKEMAYRLSEHGRNAAEAVAFHLSPQLLETDDEDDEPLEDYWVSRAVVRG
ncbi:hypothetical protein PX554_22625 [Sphingomonas sp. H39-1-10]|uniref:hypothetical protein n=1 Tax=Sphingomonas pollutisoli TaxID=3030829 RepID=UPI0023BA162C|nr:hypothetical protein [Sphingomonas pollutisoli]MDF0490928.1 hypothetical protein [Sphingomonas pollutisoli]